MKTVQVLYNDCCGGFNLSSRAVDYLNHKYGWNKNSNDLEQTRHDPRIIELFKEKGSEWMSGEYSQLQIKQIEADGYRIDDWKGGKEVVVPVYADFVVL